MAMALFSMPMQVRDARTGDVADKFVALPCAASVTSPKLSKQNLVKMHGKFDKKKQDQKKNPPLKCSFANGVCSWG